MRERWTQTLRIGVSRSGIGLISTRSWPFGKSPVLAAHSVLSDSSDPLRAAGSLLRETLQAHAVRGLLARIVLCDTLVRLFMVTPPRNAARLQDTRAAAEMRFGTLYDDAPAQWHLDADWDSRHPFLVCAMPRDLRDSLLEAAQSAGLRVVEMLPQFVVALNRWHRVLAPHDWLGVVHANRLTLGIPQNGRLVSVRVLPSTQMAELDATALAPLLTQEALRMAQPQPRHLRLCGMVPPRWLVPEADGLRLSRLGVIPAAGLAQRAGPSAPAADLDQPGLALAATGMRA